ncbi:TonB-dependent receptor [Vreelandella nanhaiensis]|uniref:TonB-dependent receptor n=1 Tax=Vreelandella nanhaiensis TaxID=1258546 RepID=A0A3S0Y6H5_9GAMM|nr:TonB-dependent receptor [Halomonas nanhaiensis]RUR31337.1 TonB-dependent receptor [Halomonas nanhaiensis]
MNRTIVLSAGLLSGAFPMLAFAQSQPQSQPESAHQETVVVVGSRTPTQISQIPGAVHVVESADLQQQISAGSDLKTALGRLVPGLDFGPQGRTNAGQNMRGRSVQVLIDGVSLNNSRSLSRQFDSIDPFNIERVEVLSGTSSLYGGGATGGLINIITKQGESGRPHFETQASVASGFNTRHDFDRRLSQSASGGNDTVQGRIGVSLVENGRQYDAGGNEIFPDIAQSDLQDNRSLDILGNVRIELSDEQTLMLSGQLYESGKKGDRGVYYPNLAAASPNLNDADIRDGFTADRAPHTDRKMFSVNYHHANLLNQDFYLQAFHREEESSFHPFPYPAQDDGYYFAASQQNTTLSGLKGLFSADLTESLNLTYGADLDKESFDATQMRFDRAASDASGGLVQRADHITPRYPGFDINTLALFAQSDWWLTDQLQLSGGIRHQRMAVDIDDYNNVPGGSSDYNVTLYNISTLYDFDNGHQSWLGYSEGFDLPDPSKYYGRPGQTVADNPLDGIKTQQVELGWRYQGGDWLTQAAVYYAWSDTAMELDSDLNITQVDDDRRDYGLEASVTRFIGDHWEVGGTLHTLTSERKVDGTWQDRGITVAPYPSQDSLTAHVAWADNDRSLRLQGSHARDYTDSDDGRIDGFTTLDLIGSQNTGFGTVSLGISNLTDKQYSTPWGQRAVGFYSPNYGPEYLYDYQGRGRTFTLGWALEY